MRLRWLAAVISLVLGAAAIAGCSSSSSSDQDTGSGKVSLTYWSWAPNMDKIAAAWNAKNPNIHVTVSKQASGDILLTKVLTAAKGGSPPDLIQAEYQALPTLVSNDVVADINDKVKAVQSDFDAGVWQQVSFGGHAYAVPQDAAPMMLYYRADLFKQYGLAVPATWDQFAAEAKTLHTKDPKRYLTTFSANDPGWFAGLSQQAGASWWKTSGDTWSVSVADAATTKVADFWGGLVNSGVVSGAPMYTPAWNKALNDGTLLAWPSAVWGPGVLVGSAPSTKGKWAIAPLPQWSAGEQKTGSWGGSSTAISAKSKHQAAAAKFATWLNTDPEAVKALVTQAAVYPACTTSAATAALASPPDFFANQPDFYQQAATIGHTAAGFTWGPNVNVTYSTYTDAFAKAIQAKSSFSAAVQAMQTATVADMKKNGFKVS